MACLMRWRSSTRRLAVSCVYVFFFFKQKTAYELMPSLVGSEMCIRDSCGKPCRPIRAIVSVRNKRFDFCLLYTSDAADDLLCVDLGGRRIIKKKNK